MTLPHLPRLAEGTACALALALAAALAHGTVTPGLSLLMIAGLVAWITCQDAASFTIPDGAVAALAFVAVGVSLADGEAALHGVGDTILSFVTDGVLCGGSLFVLREAFYRRRGYDGLGLGDVKLALAGGLLVGTGGFAWALCAASLAALAVVLVCAALRRAFRADDRLAFGAYLAPSLLAVWIVERFLPACCSVP